MVEFNTQEIASFTDLLVELERNNIDYEREEVEKAYRFAEKAHGNQKRKSGQPYIIHPLTVAAYTARLKLDQTSVIAALLHDTIEDTSVTIDQLDRDFGTEVAFIVDGLTEVKNYTARFKEHDESIETFRNLIIKSSSDIRVLIIRLCDKVHNSLTIQHLKPDRQLNFARKAMDIYAPLAETLGLWSLQVELEAAAFQIIEPEKSQIVRKTISKLRADSDEIFIKMMSDLRLAAKEHQIPIVKIYSRTKSIYSTYRKLQRKHPLKVDNVTPELVKSLDDLLAIRIITETVENCYQIMGIVHKLWPQKEEEYDDYIAQPKPNGYRSLQSISIYHDTKIEIQIRTEEMHDTNEFGAASHIAYKLHGSAKTDERYHWAKDLLQWKKQPDFRIRAFADKIFTFTPKGKIIALDKGSTPLDFAFQLHSEIGLSYTGAKVNGKMVNMSHKLQTGDIIEVLHAKATNANRDWLKYAKMRYTRYRIRKYLKSQRPK